MRAIDRKANHSFTDHIVALQKCTPLDESDGAKSMAVFSTPNLNLGSGICGEELTPAHPLS